MRACIAGRASGCHRPGAVRGLNPRPILVHGPQSLLRSAGSHAARSGADSKEESAVKNCKLCGFSKTCNSLPGICIILQFAAVAMLLGVLAYLFITQEMLN